MAIIATISKEEYKNLGRRRVIYRRGGVTYKTKRYKDESGTEVIEGKSRAAALDEAATAAYEEAPLVEQTASIQMNMAGGLRKNQAFSVEGERFNPESEVLQPTQTKIQNDNDPPKFYEKRFYTKEGQSAAFQNVKDNYGAFFGRIGGDIKRDFQKEFSVSQEQRELAATASDTKFLSKEGQAARLARADVVVKDAFSLRGGITANTGSEKANLFIENRVNNPYVAAAELTVIKGIAGGVKAGVLAATGRGAATAATKTAGAAAASGFAKRATIAAGRTISTLPAAGAKVVGGYSIVRDVRLGSSLTEEEARDLRNPRTRQLYGQTIRQQGAEISQSTIFGVPNYANQAAFGITTLGVPKVVGNLIPDIGESREAQFTRLLDKNEVSDTERSALLKYRKAAGSGEIGGLLLAGFSGERAGRAAQAYIFNKAAPTTFKAGFVKGFAAIAPAGIVEGSSGELVQQVARDEPINVQRIGAVGGIGFATAGVFGGTIVGAQASSRSGLSKFTEGLGNALDVYEYPADKLTDFAAAGSRGFRAAPTNSLTIGGIIPTQSPSNSFTQAANAQNPALSSSLTQAKANQQSLISSLSQSNTITNTKNLNNPFTYSNTPTNTQNNPFSFTQSQTLIKTQNLVTQPTQSQTQQQTQQQTNTAVTAITSSNTPVINFRFPAAPITSLGGGGGGISFGKRAPRRKQGFSIEPLVFSRLRGTAKKGQRIGLKF